MANSGMKKNANDLIPYCQDQGIPNLVGTPESGMSVQHIQVTMPADGIIVFADHGAVDMANEFYGVDIHNHTGANHGIVPTADRKVNQITITGPTTGDVLDIFLFGALKGQLA